ncbi:hypothetical protein Golomagni_05633 [Golovinomyces magnicellulatus]|nr:hypothetical protein Golomagni_05633 [Golovinomyces magnicellulatus]
MVSAYTLGIATFAAIGTFLFVSPSMNRDIIYINIDRASILVLPPQVSYDFLSMARADTDLIAIAHQSWIDYMDKPSKGITGAVVAVYIAGEAVGALIQTAIGDRLGRIRFMQALCVLVTIGTVIQTASVNIGMFLAGRAIAGMAVGGMVSTVPIYLSEISPPNQRGMIGGISGCGISFGTMMSNWVGFACSYADYGPTQWRLPLGIQVPWGVLMFAGLATFMPNSPRQLIRQDKVEEARKEFVKVRRDLQAAEVNNEFALMVSQIRFEMEREVTSYKEIFRLFRRRAFV